MSSLALTMSFDNLVQMHNQEVTTTSKIVADNFEKLHKNVLSKIDEIMAETSVEFNQLNFKPIDIEVKVGFGIRKERAFEMTKDGFMLLVMGFTGKKAMELKIRFIQAFNWAFDQLQKSTIKQREVLITACDKLAVRHALRSEVYTMVANEFGYEKPIDIPVSLIPEAVAFAYEMLLRLKTTQPIDSEYTKKMYDMGRAKADNTREMVTLLQKVLTDLDYGLKVISKNNATQFSVFESVKIESLSNC